MATVRLPSLRRPRTFYDVFGVAMIAIVTMAVVLAIWHGTLVRREMVVLLALVALWAAWAVGQILDRAANDRRLQ
ncbi:hypothetical protein [Salinilacihabitans rarus]|uniref:hypothetical protein n=1 Tax=Salinilacihabitans rarus TaxID=2961596 RepID=UPI0020C8D3F3|nr:hypothetical protein [Salinilacihabitans rarus]